MRARRGGGRLLRGGVLLPVGAALLLAGCASMPSSGEVRKVGDSQRGDADTQVRVFGVPPRPGAAPQQIVQGFLQATTSGETDFATAKDYLAQGAKWNPLAGITVYSGSLAVDEGDLVGKNAATVSGAGDKVAAVDTKGGYLADKEATFQASFHLVRTSKGWRIDKLPNGLVLSEQDFQRLYHSVNMYYFAKLGADEQHDGSSRQTLVADPVFLSNQDDPLVSTVSALLAGPTDWLVPVVDSAVPTGVRLDRKAPGGGVTLDDSQHVRIRLDRSADRLPEPSCLPLAAQVFASVQAQQASAKLSAVEVQKADGSTWCTLPQGVQDRDYRPGSLIGTASQSYYITSDGHELLALPESTTVPRSVAGPFGQDKADLESVAVRRDELVAAGVKTDGREMFVGSLVDDQSLGQPVVTSTAADPKKDGLSAPSWDGFNDLWVADRNPTDPRLLMLRDGRGTPHEVHVDNLRGRVESLRVSSDGVRIALVVKQNGFMTLQLGTVQRGTPKDPDAFSVSGLRDLTPADENVTSVSWAGASRLVVLDSAAGVQQIQYINTDGSAAPALEGINTGASSVAASEDQSKPLLASNNATIYRLPPEANWEQIQPGGDNPVYPG